MNQTFVRIICEATFVGAMAAWIGYGIDGARNVFEFFTWFISVAHLLGYCSAAAREALAKIQYGRFWMGYFFIRNVMVTTVAAWFCMPVLATVWTLAWLGFYAIREVEGRAA